MNIARGTRSILFKSGIHPPVSRYMGTSTIFPLDPPPGPPDDLITMAEAIPRPGPDITYSGLKILDKNHFDAVLQVDLMTQSKYTDVDQLMEMFERMKPALSCRGLLSPFKIKDPETGFLNEQYKLIHGRAPKHMTAYTAMRNLRKECLDFWKHGLDYFAKINAIITNEWDVWDNTAGQPDWHLLSFLYEVGPSFPPEGTPFLRGESDASYDSTTEKANIANAIWRKEDLLWAEIAKDFSFPKKSGSLLAEATAMCLLMKRSISLTEFLVAFTDNSEIEKVMRCGYHNRVSQDRIFDLLPFMKSFFRKFACRWVYRDGLKLVDALTRNQKEGLDGQWASVLIKEWQDQLEGVPVFSHIGSTHTVSDPKTPMNLYEPVCYIEAEPEMKLDTAKHVVKRLLPDYLHIIGKDIGLMEEKVVALFGHNRMAYTVSSMDSDSIDIDFGTSDNPKILCLSLDGELPEEPYDPKKYAMTVLVLTTEQKPSFPHIREFSPLGYVSYKNAPKLKDLAAVTGLPLSEEMVESKNLEKNKVVLNKDGTMMITPKTGDYARVHYSIFHEGKLLETSRGSDVPFEFKLGEGKFKGWDVAIASMRIGEHAHFTIPPVLGYGDLGSFPAIPPNATLHLEVELLHLIRPKDICKDGGIMKKVLTQGKNTRKPKDHDVVKVKYEICLDKDGTVVSRSEGEGVEFTLKDGFMCAAIAEGVKTMLKGEKALFLVNPKYGFNKTGRVAAGEEGAVPPDSNLKIELELVSWKTVTGGGDKI